MRLNIKPPASPGLLTIIGKLAFFLLLAALRRDN
jgi:hypothetical protein